jgi:hypothetical protein
VPQQILIQMKRGREEEGMEQNLVVKKKKKKLNNINSQFQYYTIRFTVIWHFFLSFFLLFFFSSSFEKFSKVMSEIEFESPELEKLENK